MMLPSQKWHLPLRSWQKVPFLVTDKNNFENIMLRKMKALWDCFDYKDSETRNKEYDSKATIPVQSWRFQLRAWLNKVRWQLRIKKTSITKVIQNEIFLSTFDEKQLQFNTSTGWFLIEDSSRVDSFPLILGWKDRNWQLRNKNVEMSWRMIFESANWKHRTDRLLNDGSQERLFW